MNALSHSKFAIPLADLIQADIDYYEKFFQADDRFEDLSRFTGPPTHDAIMSYRCTTLREICDKLQWMTGDGATLLGVGRGKPHLYTHIPRGCISDCHVQNECQLAEPATQECDKHHTVHLSKCLRSMFCSSGYLAGGFWLFDAAHPLWTWNKAISAPRCPDRQSFERNRTVDTKIFQHFTCLCDTEATRLVFLVRLHPWQRD
ncbi:hypothetical protein [Pararhizobium arenae]|uniref:hypothetical protein n=1 Tax=Pararhizobium arenae TaxID=1856850 RepID=UPI00117A41F9|nr:hypothetical protein [Pararhizobium arenae]